MELLQIQNQPVDICTGADPFVFRALGQWNLLLQENNNSQPEAHNGLRGYTLRRANTLEDLDKAIPISLKVCEQETNLKQVWAAEIHNRYLYVTASNGDNREHRMYVFKTEKDCVGPWREVGKLKTLIEDDSWAIDLTRVKIKDQGKTKKYAFWSGWENPEDDFPQNLYIAETTSAIRINKRHLLWAPNEEWNSSVKPILEGPQALYVDKTFRGLLVSGNASWTDKYQVRVLKYLGGNPLIRDSWKMAKRPLVTCGYGIGHGVVVQDTANLYFVGHRKTLLEDGWEDRAVFYVKLGRDELENYLDEIN